MWGSTFLLHSTAAPLYILLTKMYALFINTSFFAAQLRLKNSTVVACWSHTPKVPVSNPGISSKFTFSMISPKFWVSRISNFGDLGSLGYKLSYCGSSDSDFSLLVEIALSSLCSSHENCCWKDFLLKFNSGPEKC